MEMVDTPGLQQERRPVSEQLRRMAKRRLAPARPGRVPECSHLPQVSPNATRTEVVGRIIYLRQHYHFGPAMIAMYLKRYHDIQISPSGVSRVHSTRRDATQDLRISLRRCRPAGLFFASLMKQHEDRAEAEYDSGDGV